LTGKWSAPPMHAGRCEKVRRPAATARRSAFPRKRPVKRARRRPSARCEGGGVSPALEQVAGAGDQAPFAACCGSAAAITEVLVLAGVDLREPPSAPLRRAAGSRASRARTRWRAPSSHPRGALPARVRIHQKRDHHRRIVRRPAMPVSAIVGIERRQIHRVDRRDHKPRKVILRQPLVQTRRQQNACPRSHPRSSATPPASS
jgi:hypothetical protein